MLGKISLTDEDILESIRSGNEKMLVLLYKRNYSPLRSHVLKNSGTESDVDDLLQESLVAFWQKVQDRNFTLTAKIDTFIYAIAKNIWYSHLRKVRYTILNDGSIDIKDTQEEAYTEDKLQILSKYVAQLSEACRNILQLFYYDNLDMEAIAARLNFANADTVKAKKYQCKKKLEDIIKQHHTISDFFS